MSFNGVVDWFSRNKGYGFVKRLESEDRLFIHRTNISGTGFLNLFPGEYVSFDIETNDDKKQCNNLTGFCGGNLLCQNDKYYFKIYQRRTNDINESKNDVDSNGEEDDVE